MWGLWPFAGEMEQEGEKFGSEREGGGGVGGSFKTPYWLMHRLTLVYGEMSLMTAIEHGGGCGRYVSTTLVLIGDMGDMRHT